MTTSPGRCFNGTGLVVVLRPWRRSDAEAIARACDDPEMPRFLVGFPSPYMLADAHAWLDRIQTFPQQGDHPYAVVDEDDELLGSITLHLGDDPPSIGYWVAPWARGRGVATAALTTLARWAVREGELAELHLTTDPENIASQRVAEKAGFELLGLVADYPLAGGARDSLVYVLRGT